MPDPQVPAILAASEATWPSAEYAAAGGLRTGRAMGAGGRVGSTRAVGPWTPDDIIAAETQHHAWGQPALFRVFDGEDALAEALGARGYRPIRPTPILAAPVGALASQPVGKMTAFCLWPPLAVQRQIWAEGSIGPARQAVMDRAPQPKTSLLGRQDDRAAGAGFVAVHDKVAMLHALEVAPAFRRRGLGVALARKAAHWAAGEGARTLALAVSLDNSAACALYAAMGFTEAARYRYFQQPGTE
ncbi:GNAT family N-acetyltransferase [Paracoccus suum]|uniref:GNAT family N-acetyltransferase n=1 Tax=Paracoccus suum TaxID=2259340 RepID=A0A344PGT3_9RHOB|nr:GNAT family N-acetyltransferase [Paracoccus suum]AXC48588.1 GNAT family N-acetyltransferase [Paracoccus suum]